MYKPESTNAGATTKQTRKAKVRVGIKSIPNRLGGKWIMCSNSVLLRYWRYRCSSSCLAAADIIIRGWKLDSLR